MYNTMLSKWKVSVWKYVDFHITRTESIYAGTEEKAFEIFDKANQSFPRGTYYTFVNESDGINYRKWKYENAKWVIESYGFLLEHNDCTMTGEEFANRIARVYDISNPRNRMAVRLAKTTIKSVTRTGYGTESKITSVLNILNCETQEIFQCNKL